ncbi:DUF3515 domain-containing protein [Corynebacterium sp. ES2715-CONJ3]|uniref:DUF3515 domain-containing protein n=1 Tax=Corynebacterium sp. ES2715-CONJ3 TaxID=2974028 RepID=UPI00216A28B2|nr:DUF3515 domain-containing protein [Corynebacterium sp. ES2715-CONJ3]MCS4492525.1 DUF3515 domain-containing protein [Corynebacterium sp. ES2715-CONJ3]
MQSSPMPVRPLPIVIALILAMSFMVAVLVGAKMVYNHSAHQPVAMSTLDTPESSSIECEEFLAALPTSVLGHPRADIVAPIPPGAAAWSSSSLERITARCGVNLPRQYTSLSNIVEVGGTRWLEVSDATPASTLKTWYSVNRAKIIAITADDLSLGDHPHPLEDIAAAVAIIPHQEFPPNPIPLSGLSSAVGPQQKAACQEVLAALPNDLDSGYRRSTTDLGTEMVAWSAPGEEAIVVRCGVEYPQNYTAGAALQQVNDIVWFEDVIVGNGTTASTWYAINKSQVVAAHIPQARGNAALVAISQAVSQHL